MQTTDDALTPGHPLPSPGGFRADGSRHRPVFLDESESVHSPHPSREIRWGGGGSRDNALSRRALRDDLFLYWEKRQIRTCPDTR